MTFLAREYSSYGGEPVILYEFRRGSLALNYTAADQDVVVGTTTYTSTAISHAGVKQSGDAVTDALQITAPYSLDIGAWFRFTPPSDIVYVTIRRYHFGDTEAVVVWLGSVVSVATDEIGKVTVNCQAVSVSLKRGGLRLAWQRNCPHALYDQNCRADKTLFAQPVTISTVNANSLSVTAFPYGGATDPYWPGGFIEWLIGPLTYERRMIENASPGVVVPYGNMDGYSAGLAITMYPGCLRTSLHCDSFFNNLVNFGGYEFMPQRSPYDGNPIF